MQLLAVLFACLAWLALAKPSPASAPQLAPIIDTAPSVVSYQGSAQTHTRFVIAPMGRALGYVEPTNLNRTTHTQSEEDLRDLPRPIYVHQ